MDANGAVDPSYQLIHPPFSNLTSGLMELMHPLSDGRLFVVSRRNRDRILQVRNPDGSPDTSFNAALTLLESTRQAGPGEVVRAVAEMEDGRLILAGNFDTYGEFPVIDHFRINADGSFDPSYESTGGFGLGDIISIVQRPGFLFFTSSAPARDNLNRLNSFQGNFDLGGGPVRVFNGGQESEPSLGDWFGQGARDLGDGYYEVPGFGLLWSAPGGLTYSEDMQRWLYFRLNGPSVADADGLWFSSLLDDGQALWTHTQQALLNSANASNHRIVYIPGGLAGASGWFYYDTQSRQFIPIL